MRAVEPRLPVCVIAAPRHGWVLRRPIESTQYVSAEYRAALVAPQSSQSMSRKRHCWANAVAESFFATLERELLARTVLDSHHEANVDLTDFIEHWYNRERQHSTLDYVSPQQYEDQLRQRARAA